MSISRRLVFEHPLNDCKTTIAEAKYFVSMYPIAKTYRLGTHHDQTASDAPRDKLTDEEATHRGLLVLFERCLKQAPESRQNRGRDFELTKITLLFRQPSKTTQKYLKFF